MNATTWNKYSMHTIPNTHTNWNYISRMGRHDEELERTLNNMSISDQPRRTLQSTHRKSAYSIKNWAAKKDVTIQQDKLPSLQVLFAYIALQSRYWLKQWRQTSMKNYDKKEQRNMHIWRQLESNTEHKVEGNNVQIMWNKLNRPRPKYSSHKENLVHDPILRKSTTW
jgi:hypothetical protein